MDRLLEMSFESAKAVPRVHKAERLARGIKVVDTDPVSNPGSAQGGAEWRVTIYQPERKEPPPDLKAVNAHGCQHAQKLCRKQWVSIMNQVALAREYAVN